MPYGMCGTFPYMAGRFEVRVPEDLEARVRARAAEDERSVSWIVRKALEEYLGVIVLPDDPPIVVDEPSTAVEAPAAPKTKVAKGTPPDENGWVTIGEPGREQYVCQCGKSGKPKNLRPKEPHGCSV